MASSEVARVAEQSMAAANTTLLALVTAELTFLLVLLAADLLFERVAFGISLSWG